MNLRFILTLFVLPLFYCPLARSAELIESNDWVPVFPETDPSANFLWTGLPLKLQSSVLGNQTRYFFTLTGHVIDKNTAILIDRKPLTLDDHGDFSVSVPLEKRDRTVTVSHVDRAGAIEKQSLLFHYRNHESIASLPLDKSTERKANIFAISLGMGELDTGISKSKTLVPVLQEDFKHEFSSAPVSVQQNFTAFILAARTNLSGGGFYSAHLHADYQVFPQSKISLLPTLGYRMILIQSAYSDLFQNNFSGSGISAGASIQYRMNNSDLIRLSANITPHLNGFDFSSSDSVQQLDFNYDFRTRFCENRFKIGMSVVRSMLHFEESKLTLTHAALMLGMEI